MPKNSHQKKQATQVQDKIPFNTINAFDSFKEYITIVGKFLLALIVLVLLAYVMGRALTILFIVFCAGAATGRKSHEWKGWNYILHPVLLFLQANWWVLCVIGGILVTVLAEAGAELFLDTFREQKLYPLWGKESPCRR